MRTIGAQGEGEVLVHDRPASAALATAARVGLVLAIALGVVVRFVQPSAMWLDEALSTNISRLPLGDIGTALLRDGHPPLYYWLLHGWMDVFGTSNPAIRALSGVFAVAMLPFAWWAGTRVGGRLVGAWTLFIAALSPYAIHYATEARMYSLVMLLVLAGVVAVYTSLERPRALPLIGVAFVAGALLWAHYWSMYLVAVTGTYMLAIAIWRPARRRAALWCAAAIAVGSSTFLLWVPSLLDQLGKTGTPWSVRTGPTEVLTVTVSDLGGGGWPSSLLLGMLVVALALIGLFGRLDDDERAVQLTGHLRPSAVPVLGVSAATLIVAIFVQQASGTGYVSRYAAVIVPLIWIGAAVGATQVPRTWPRVTVALLVVVFSTIGIVQDIRLDRTTARTMADQIVPALEADDVVVACPDQLGVGIDRELRAKGARVPVLAYPALGDPRFIDWRDYAARNAAADPVAFADEVSARAGSGNVWLYTGDTYLGLEDACADVMNRLAELRPRVSRTDAPDALFEQGDLVRFGPPTGS